MPTQVGSRRWASGYVRRWTEEEVKSAVRPVVPAARSKSKAGAEALAALNARPCNCLALLNLQPQKKAEGRPLQKADVARGPHFSATRDAKNQLSNFRNTICKLPLISTANSPSPRPSPDGRGSTASSQSSLSAPPLWVTRLAGHALAVLGGLDFITICPRFIWRSPVAG